MNGFYRKNGENKAIMRTQEVTSDEGYKEKR